MYRLLTLSIVIILMAPVRSQAAGMDIGGSAWMSWWLPTWSQQKRDYAIPPSFFYGPLLSFRMPYNITLSSCFFYAKFNAKNKYGIWEDTAGFHRYDSDSTIKYAFTKYFNIFLGFKYSRYRIRWSKITFQAFNFLYNNRINTTMYNEYAPAIGMSFTVHLVDRLYLLISLSFIYDFSHEHEKIKTYTFIEYSWPAKNYLAHKAGANSQISFAYTAPVIDTTFSLGFRYQTFFYVKMGSSEVQRSKVLEHYYGVTASILYRIDFTRKKADEGDKEKEEEKTKI